MKKKRQSLSPPWVDAVDLRLSGFPWPNRHSPLQCILHGSSDPQAVYDNFVENLMSALGSRYLPVYRMADGEFLFCLGWRPPLSREPQKNEFINDIIRGFREKKKRLRGFGTMWGENYTAWESFKGRHKLPALIRRIVREGFLGLYFMRREDLWGEEFIVPMTKWFKKHNILLSEQNYVPFYMVYAALSKEKELFHNRKILVATSLTPKRREGIESGLKDAGAAQVEFLNISATKSMFQDIDLGKIKDHPDLVLTGAGIGSANVIVQLDNLPAPVIDAGIFLECLINPAHRAKRPFLLPEF